MSIQFEQVEGVVQRDAEEAAPAEAAEPTTQSPQPTPAEQFRAHYERMEWMTRRLMAD
ncbi:MAG: hypothetical protein DIU78_022640 [Pseudomonadota bacterium]